MSITLNRIEGLTVGHWVQRNGIIEGTTERGEVLSVSTTGGLAKWTNGTQSSFRWEDPGLKQIDPPQAAAPTAPEAEYAVTHSGAEGFTIPVDDIAPFFLQARSLIEEASLESLAASIRERGVLQPILVRPAHPDLGKKWELISGERRWRASILAGLTTIRAEVHDVDNRQAAILSTEENTQRRNLGTMELCRAVRLLESVGLSQTEIGAFFPDEKDKPRSQSWVSRTADLVSLPGQVQGYLETGQLSKTAGEELLPLRRWPKELIDLARQAVDGEWSVAALAANAKTLKARMEKRDQLPFEEPEPELAAQQRVTTTETETTVTRTETTVTPPTAPPAEPQSAAEAPVVAGDAQDLSAAAEEAPAATEPETKPNVLKSAEELVADRAGTAVPTTVGAAVLDGPVTMCMVLQDCQSWVAAEGLTVKDFLGRLKAAAYTRGLDAGSLLASLEVS